MGVEGRYQLRVKAIEAGNVKIGMQFSITMYVTTTKGFSWYPLKGWMGVEERHQSEANTWNLACRVPITMYVTTEKGFLQNHPLKRWNGVERTYHHYETTEARKQKFGMLAPIMMYVTSKKKIFRNRPLKRWNRGWWTYQCKAKASKARNMKFESMFLLRCM